ncbi:Mycolysin [Thermoflexales bacterium]|nr:Mycolysin [Thermoflexales bacterium]
MNTFANKIVRYGLSLGLWVAPILGIVIGRAPAVTTPQPIVVNGDPHTPLEITLTLDELPRLDRAVVAAITVVSRRVDSAGVSVRLLLPANLAALSDQTEWQVDLKADEPVSFKAELQATGTGNALLQASAQRVLDEENVWADLATLYFHAAAAETSLGWRYGVTPALAVPAGTALTADIGVTEIQQEAYALNGPPSLNAPAAPADDSAPGDAPQPDRPAAPDAPAGNITITGRWYYDDRAGVQQPVKILVEILNSGDSHLAWAYSEWDGSYSVTIANPGQFKVRMYTYYKHVNMALSALRIVPDGNFNSGEEFDVPGTYNVTTGVFGPYADGTRDIGGWKPSSSWDGRFAWWVYADMLEAFFHPWYCTPYCGSNGSWDPDGTTAEWSYTSTDGDYFDYSKVNLEGTTRNSASTIIHEYGHAIMQNVYGGSGAFPTNDCPSPHYIQYIGNWNCAWTEGWANYFSMAVRNENFYRWASGSTLNLETPSWSSASWDDGERVEGRLAGWLWDMTDHANDGLDVWDAPNGFAEIWDVIYNQNDNTVANFYSAWVSRGHSDHHALFEAYQNTIDYDTAPTLSGIPNVTRLAGPANNVIDLWPYASDAESSDSQLTYTIQSVSDAGVGASIDAGDFIDLNPAPGWWGTSTVTVKASDGAKSDTDVFIITLQPRRVFLPLVIR